MHIGDDLDVVARTQRQTGAESGADVETETKTFAETDTHGQAERHPCATMRACRRVVRRLLIRYSDVCDCVHAAAHHVSMRGNVFGYVRTDHRV